MTSSPHLGTGSNLLWLPIPLTTMYELFLLSLFLLSCSLLPFSGDYVSLTILPSLPLFIHYYIFSTLQYNLLSVVSTTPD
jgi:hypothetical protein